MSKLTIETLCPDHFDALAELQRIVYPTLGDQELMSAEHFAAQYRLFPQGQIIALIDGQVVGQGSGFFIDFDLNQPNHSFREICADLYFSNHDPNGAYYYGADISVHPDFRRQGIGTRIYHARQELVRKTNRRGIVGGGLIPGYAAFKTRLSPQEYVDKVIVGELYDGTLSFQLSMGFEVRGIIANYLEDSASDNWATLIEWVNSDFVPSKP